MAKGKTKLKGLEVSKVDFVDAGANPGADIVLTKRQEPPAGEGFWKGLIAYIKKQMAADPQAAQAAAEAVEKSGAQTFNDRISQRSLDRIQDEIWNVCYALEGSLISILRDEELDPDEKKEAMEQSAEEFSQAVGGFIARWCKGTTANVEKQLKGAFEPQPEALLAIRDLLDRKIGQAGEVTKQNSPAEEPENEKGGSEMKIDKSKMTPEDAAQFERMAKAYGWSEEAEAAGAAGQEGSGSAAAQAGMGSQAAQPPAGSTAAGEDGVNKGLHPAVQAELEALRKMRQELEGRELYEVAKKYEVIGKKADELAPVLKSMKAAGDDSYNSYLAILDEMVSMQEASGMFGEIGKAGGHVPAGATDEDVAFQKARGAAAEIRKSRPELTQEQAIDLAISQDPELQAVLM